MEQFISEALFDNPLEGLLENQYLEEFDFTKTKNNLRKQKDFVLERTYFNKLMDARAKLPN